MKGLRSVIEAIGWFSYPDASLELCFCMISILLVKLLCSVFAKLTFLIKKQPF